MCGIAGVYRYAGNAPIDGADLERMVESLRHRGPDDSGTHIVPPIGLGHTRLSIIDLSKAGHQPFSDETGRYTIVYNGEIYNYRELRDWLKGRGHRFRSLTDTEVVLRLYMESGSSAVEKLIGMFALAIWDAEDEVLFLARDRTGEKPLVYTDHAGSFFFSSEIRSVLENPEIPREPDPVALGSFIATGKFIPYPRTAYSAVKKLPPAHTMTVSSRGIVTRRYWSPNFSEKTSCSLNDATDQLDELLNEVVNSMLVSDVPIGLLLSGGVDSSLIAYRMRSHAHEMHSFACGNSSDDEEFLRARAVASRLDTTHREHVYRLENDALLRVLAHFGEPIFEGSIVYRIQMCEFIRRQGVTVLLTGNGADEVFGGYASYSLMRRYPFIKRVLAGVSALPGIRSSPFVRDNLLPRVELHSHPTASAVANALTRDMAMRLERLNCRHPQAIGAVEEMRDTVRNTLYAARVDNVVDGVLFADLMFRLHYNHVMVPDAVGMSQSLELRSPFLDSRIIEFAASLPHSIKVQLNPRRNKLLLKHLLCRDLSDDLVYAPKIGYGTNINYLQDNRAFWLDLYSEARSNSSLLEMGLVDSKGLARHEAWGRNGSRAELAHLVSIVLLELWLDQTFGSGALANSIEQIFHRHFGDTSAEDARL